MCTTGLAWSANNSKAYKRPWRLLGLYIMGMTFPVQAWLMWAFALALNTLSERARRAYLITSGRYTLKG